MLQCFVRAAILSGLAIVVIRTPMPAQVTGRISGFVRDPSGAPAPAASVTARMTEQQSTHAARTNGEGFYDLIALPPGAYEITFEAPGFQRQVRSGIELSINQNLRVDAGLEVGSVDTQVTVAGTAPLVDTVSPVLSGLIDDRRVVDLPINGRNIMSLAGILPGVVGVSVSQNMDNARSGPIMNVNGGRSNMNLFTFNGAYFNNPSRNTGVNFRFFATTPSTREIFSRRLCPQSTSISLAPTPAGGSRRTACSSSAPIRD